MAPPLAVFVLSSYDGSGAEEARPVVVPVSVFEVQLGAAAPVVLLRELDEPHRVLPIVIGAPEALSIAAGLEGGAPRPLTHDLLVEILRRTDTRLRVIELTEVRDGTFHAELELEGAGGVHRLPSRPSDAIAVAVRLGVPVHASEEVLAEAGVLLETLALEDPGSESASAEQVEQAVEEFRAFLAEVEPGDFADEA